MQFLLNKNEKNSLFEQAREQLLIALHTGKVMPGDRLPSVRQVALSNKLNIKTAFAVYRHLQEEGFITLRTGSGAYVSDFNQVDLEHAYHLSLYKLIKSNLAEARRLRLDPMEYASLVQKFIDPSQPKRLSVGVIECNKEQVSLFAKEISDRLGARVVPLLLEQLGSGERRTSSLLKDVDCLATTDFHFREVRVLTEGCGKKLLRLRLNPDFIPTIIDAAKRGGVLMIVSDTDYFPAFSHRLLDLGIKSSVINRINAIGYDNLNALRAALPRAKAVYVSPLCDAHVRRLIPSRARELKVEGLLSNESLEMLHALMLFMR